MQKKQWRMNMSLSSGLSVAITASICLTFGLLTWADVSAQQYASQESCIDCDSVDSNKHIAIASIDWCPYICAGNEQKPGILTEYVQQIFKDTGYTISFTTMPWARAIHETHSGNFLALLAPAKEEAPGLVFPNLSLGYQTMCMFTREDDPWQYNGIPSLKGRRIVHVIGAFPASLEQARGSAIFYPISYDSETFVDRSLKMVLNKRTDTLLSPYYSTQDYINRKGLNDHIKTAGCAQQQALYLAFTPLDKEKKKVEKLTVLFDQKIAELEKIQTFEKLLKRYGLTPIDTASTPEAAL